MNKQKSNLGVSRREFLRNSTLLVAGTALAPYVLTTHAAPDSPEIKVGLIGCGGRGSGAIRDAIKAAPNVKAVALADVFEDHVKGCQKGLKNDGIEVPDSMCFHGFDAYKKVLEIPEINYVILATPPGFRPIHFKAAIEAGKNVFFEKPVAVDGPGIRMVIEAGELAKQKGLSVVAGTQRRHEFSYIETIKRLQDGAIGDIVCLRAYWNQGLIWGKPWDPNKSDMENMLRNWYCYVWLCGDHIVEQHVHNLDVCNWIMGTHPIKAYGQGGRQVRSGKEHGHIYDHFAVEYEYPNGVRMFSQCRQISGCSDNVSEAAVGLKGTSNPAGSISVKGGDSWRYSGQNPNPYVQEHKDNIDAIRTGKPLNEARQVAESTLTAIMGRESAYSGQIISWDEALNSKRSLMPEKLEFGPMPYPEVAMPGKYKFM
jgi:predicted dehydrogenase